MILYVTRDELGGVYTRSSFPGSRTVHNYYKISIICHFRALKIHSIWMISLSRLKYLRIQERFYSDNEQLVLK